MIDPETEDLIYPADVVRMLPPERDGKHRHLSFVYRAMRVGIRGVILESLDVPRKCSSRQAVVRFIRRLSGQNTDPTPQAPTRQNRRRSQRRVEEELDRLGL
jgi:hypothetical protein